jgi:16S rRNA G966 N2-methylase RsmD
VLDLFAGTGALGIEALSRGAAYVLFVDDGAEARALLRNNVEALGLGGVTKVFGDFALDGAWRQVGHRVTTVRWRDGRMVPIVQGPAHTAGLD